jgi:fibronectin type 3 domain-containing protein
VQLYIGQAAYKIASWSDINEMPKQLQYNLTIHEVLGSIFFSMKDLLANPDNIRNRLSSDIYRQSALIPTMSWLTGKAPQSVTLQSTQQAGSTIVLHWQDVAGNNTAYYAIYRVESAQQCQMVLLDTMRKAGNGAQEFRDSTTIKGKTYTYYVTALDRLHHESKASAGMAITIH